MSNFFFKGGPITLQGVAALGTGAVSDVTRVVAVAPCKMRVTSIKLYADNDITGTDLTVDVLARTAAGAAGSTLLSAAVSINVADQAAARAGVSTTLTATLANRIVAEGQLIEAFFDATSVTAGPGDVAVVIKGVPIV